MLCIAASSSAKVYQRIAFSDSGEALAARMGLVRGYATKLDVNGVPARMEVFGSRDIVWRTLDQLRLEEPNGVFFDGEDMAWGFLVDGSDYVRYLLVAGGPGHTATVYRMVVDEREWLRSRGKDQRHQLTQVPVPASSRPGFYMADKTTRTEIEVSKSTQGKQQLAGQLVEGLLDKGWSPASRNVGGLGVYTKGRDVLTLRIADRDGERIITRIYKKGATTP